MNTATPAPQIGTPVTITAPSARHDLAALNGRTGVVIDVRYGTNGRELPLVQLDTPVTPADARRMHGPSTRVSDVTEDDAGRVMLFSGSSCLMSTPVHKQTNRKAHRMDPTPVTDPRNVDFPDARHLIGRPVTAETADDFGTDSVYDERSTLSGVVAAIEDVDSEGRHVRARLASGLRVRLHRNLVEVTAPR